MRKLLRSMARAAMVSAGIERINRDKRFAENWRRFYQHQVKSMSENVSDKTQISKIGRKFTMFKQYESIKADKAVRKIIATL